MATINLAQDFTKHPAGRYKVDGSYSGELFREMFLEPIISKLEKTVIFLDGTRGYSSAFLDEAFGGIVRKYSEKIVNDCIIFKSRDDVLLFRVSRIIKNASQ
jgi:hypothetical protein